MTSITFEFRRSGTFSLKVRPSISSRALRAVRACRATVAALYADAPDGTSLPLIAPFIAFVEQAGRSLEASLLARRTPQAVSC